MHLTQSLCKYHHLFIGKIPKHPGSVFTGKNRWVRPATRATTYMLWSQWRTEMEVLKYIDKPYVTEDQELDYLDSVGLKHHEVDPLHTSTVVTPMQQFYASDLLELMDRARKHEVLE